MASGRAIFQAHVDGVLPESLPIDLQWTLTGTVVVVQYPVTLAAGDNTLSFPAGTTLIVLVPPTTNTAVLKSKGVGGDTGWVLQSTQPTVFTFTAGGSAIINASAQVTGCKLIFLA